jgi:hypothetical protein
MSRPKTDNTVPVVEILHLMVKLNSRTNYLKDWNSRKLRL